MSHRLLNRRAGIVIASCALLGIVVGTVTLVVRHRGTPQPPPSPVVITSPLAPPPVVAAVAATVTARTARLRFTVTLSRGLAAAFGDAGDKPLPGTGNVDFSTEQAAWTLELPTNLGGAAVQFVADHSTTYVRLPGAAAASQWIALRTSDDYTGFDEVPLARDLAVLSNPMRMLDLVDSMRAGSPGPSSSSAAPSRTPALSPGAATSPVAASGEAATMTAYERAITPASPAPTTAPQPKGCSAQAVTASVAPSQIYDLFSINLDAQAGVLNAWTTNQVTARGANGVCQARVSVTNASDTGFDIKVDFSDPGGPETITVPGGKDVADYSVIAHVTETPCWIGTWDGRSNVTIPGASGSADTATSALEGGGNVHLEMSLAGTALTSSETLNGLVTRPRIQLEPDPKTGGLITTLVPTDYPVTFTRHIDADGGPAIAPPAPDPLTDRPLTVVATGTALETEQGSPTGAQTYSVESSWSLRGSLRCDGADPPQLTLTSGTFGTMVMTRTSATFPPALSGARLVVNWRLVPAVPTPPPTPTPSTAGTTTGAIGATLQAADGLTVHVVSLGPAAYSSANPLPPAPHTTLEALEVTACVSPHPIGHHYVNPVQFTLQTADGASIKPALGAVDHQLTADPQAPGACVQGRVAFQVPSATSVKRVIFAADQVTGDSLSWSVP